MTHKPPPASPVKLGRPYVPQGPAGLSRELDPTKKQVTLVNLTLPQVHFVNYLYRRGCHGNTPARVVHWLVGQSILLEAQRLGYDLTAIGEGKAGRRAGKEQA